MSEPLVSHLAFLGITVQFVSAILLGALLWELRRRSPGRAYLRDWAAAFTALALAIGALFVGYLFSGRASTPVRHLFWTTLSPRSALVFCVYQGGKLAFFGLLLVGAMRFSGRRFGRAGRVTGALLGAYAVTTAIATHNLDRIVILQTPVAAVACAAASLTLLLAPAARRSFGSRSTGVVLAAMSLLWVLYSWSFTRPPIGDDLAGIVLSALVFYNSFVDVTLQTLLGFGMVIALFLDLQREADRQRTEREALEARLAEMRRFEALGVVASGVAHELNNPLTAILGFSEQLIGEKCALDQPEPARVIHEQALRCRAIVRDLLFFARSATPPRREAVHLAPIVQRVARGLSPQAHEHGVTVEIDVEPGLPPIEGDPVGIEQIATNLLQNAIQASPRGGTVSLRTDRTDGRVQVAVEDEGPGVPPELHERVFEPFFTTKSAGEGTGLGLTVSQGIARAHGGAIAIGSRADGRAGARFVVSLPANAENGANGAIAANGASGAVVERAHAAPATPLRSEPERRLLIVDDEHAVRRMLRLVLQRAGWIVDEAEDGAEAQDAIARAHPPYRAIVTDLRMPRVTGMELFAWLRERHPELAACTVAITGETVSPEIHRFVQSAPCPILHKPLDLARLRETLAKLTAPQPA